MKDTPKEVSFKKKGSLTGEDGKTLDRYIDDYGQGPFLVQTNLADSMFVIIIPKKEDQEPKTLRVHVTYLDLEDSE